MLSIVPPSPPPHTRRNFRENLELYISYSPDARLILFPEISKLENTIKSVTSAILVGGALSIGNITDQDIAQKIPQNVGYPQQKIKIPSPLEMIK